MTPTPAPAAGILQLQELIEKFIGISVGLAFFVLTVMLVVGAIKFITSGGDKKALGSAQMTITWAILGVLFLGLAWLVLLMIEAFTGVPVTQFCLGFPGAPTQCP